MMEASRPKASPHPSSLVMTAEPTLTMMRFAFASCERWGDIARVVEDTWKDRTTCRQLLHMADPLRSRNDLPSPGISYYVDKENKAPLSSTITARQRPCASPAPPTAVLPPSAMEDRKEFSAGPWLIAVTRSHILRSKCEKGSRCADDDPHPCTVCRFSRELELPWLPDMVFPRNCLCLQHDSGAGVEFWALDALKLVDTEHESVHVAAAEQWRETRAEGLREVKVKMKPFDWTFTTTYSGTLKSSGGASIREVETEETIDYNLLQQQERIFFFDDLVLFEDELADNGTAELRVKIRVMASGFFILLRFFLRVDGVIVRLNDTRLYHQANSNHLLREVSCREARLPDPRLSLDTLKDVNKLSNVLPHTCVTSHKLILPS